MFVGISMGICIAIEQFSDYDYLTYCQQVQQAKIVKTF